MNEGYYFKHIIILMLTLTFFICMIISGLHKYFTLVIIFFLLSIICSVIGLCNVGVKE